MTGMGRPRHARRPEVEDLNRLLVAIDALTARNGGLLDRLRHSLRAPTAGASLGTIGRHAVESSEPWTSDAAGVYWGIHFGVRELERILLRARGLPVRPRGGSHENTRSALVELHGLAVAAPGEIVRRAANRVEHWVSAARRIHDVDETERWVQVPRVAGALPPACPYCGNLSLRMSRERGEVRCFTPECHDLDGARPVARMERGRVSGEGLLVFGDTTVVHYREENAKET
jgi:hypothetical protein